MKKGKTTRISSFDSLKVNYGTVDSKELKSIYINIQSWANPKISTENWQRIVSNLSREIKHTVYNHIDKELFKEENIVDLDLRTSGISIGKKSFMNLEINLFTNKSIDFKSYIIKEFIKKFVQKINQENFRDNEYFEFSISKK